MDSGFTVHVHVPIMFYLCYVKQRCSETNLGWLILSMDVFYAPKQIVMKQKFRVNNLRKKNHSNITHLLTNRLLKMFMTIHFVLSGGHLAKKL